MLGLRHGATLRNVPPHHDADRRDPLAGNPMRAARAAARDDATESWTPPVLRTTAASGEGVDALVTALDRHFAFLESSDDLRRRRRARLRERVVDVAEARVRSRLWSDADTNAWLDAQLPRLEAGTTNPFEVADELLARSGDVLTRRR
jgi:LAO/AO transport system kinase